jgi:hypothetical protein
MSGYKYFNRAAKVGDNYAMALKTEKISVTS